MLWLSSALILGYETNYVLPSRERRVLRVGILHGVIMKIILYGRFNEKKL